MYLLLSIISFLVKSVVNNIYKGNRTMKYTKRYIHEKLGQMKVIVDENLEALQKEVDNVDPHNFQTPIFDSVVDKLREIDNNIVEYCADYDGTSTLVFDVLAENGWLNFDVLTHDKTINELNKKLQTTL